MSLALALTAPQLTSDRAHQITALELQRALHKRQHRDVQGHALVLASCYRKIKRVAAVDSISCIFEVPEFVIGAPPFDLTTAVSYVISNLERNGYTVSYMFPRALLISWDLEGGRETYDGRRLPKENPASVLEPSTVASPVMAAHVPHTISPSRFLPQPETGSMADTMTVPMLDFGLQMPPLLPNLAPRTTGFKPISEFKPKGRFVMRL